MIIGLCYWWWLLWNISCNIDIRLIFATLSTFEICFELIILAVFSENIIKFFRRK